MWFLSEGKAQKEYNVNHPRRHALTLAEGEHRTQDRVRRLQGALPLHFDRRPDMVL
jgi:hypothetical protein